MYGDWLPRYIDIGYLRMIYTKSYTCDRRFTALCGILRMIYLSIILVFKCLFSSDGIGDWHVIFLDGLPSSIPILSAFGLPVLFYCHFPDKYVDYYDNLIFKLHLNFFIYTCKT